MLEQPAYSAPNDVSFCPLARAFHDKNTNALILPQISRPVTAATLLHKELFFFKPFQ
jgi:hypothetical protein